MKKYIQTVIVVALMMGITAPLASAAGFTFYTNYSAFSNAVSLWSPSPFVESFSSLTPGRAETNSMSFSNANYAFTAMIPGNPATTSLWVESYNGYAALSTGDPVEEIVLTNISANTYAMGAYFYPTDGGVKPTSTLSISVLFSDLTSTLITTNRASSSVTDWFFGWVTDDPGTAIKSIVVHDPGDTAFTTASQVVLAVPEPSTYALLLMGAGTALWMAKRRKR